MQVTDGILLFIIMVIYGHVCFIHLYEIQVGRAYFEVDAVPVVDLKADVLGLRFLDQEVEGGIEGRIQGLALVMLQRRDTSLHKIGELANADAAAHKLLQWSWTPLIDSCILQILEAGGGTRNCQYYLLCLS